MTTPKCVDMIFMILVLNYITCLDFIRCTNSSIIKSVEKYGPIRNSKEFRVDKQSIKKFKRENLMDVDGQRTSHKQYDYYDYFMTTEKSYDDSYGERSKEIFLFSPPTFKMTTQILTKGDIAQEQGPFYDFIVGICQIIINEFSSSAIPKYFGILSYSLRKLRSG